MTRLFTLLFLLGSSPLFCQNAGDHLFDSTIVHEIRFESDDPNLIETLFDNFLATFEAPYIYTPVKVIIDGNVLDTVGLRAKGGISVFEDKKPLKIDFNYYNDAQKYDGLKKVNIHNLYFDNSLLREILAYDIMRTAGVKTVRTAYANVYINDEWQGIYLLVEQIDKTFLRNYFSDDEGSLYKNRICEVVYESGEETMAYHEEMLDIVNNTLPSELYQNLEPVMDTRSFLKYMFIELLTNIADNPISADCNYFIYHEPRSDLMTWIPWDLNFSFYFANYVLDFSPPNPFLTKILAAPEYQEMFLDIACQTLSYNFTPERLFPMIDGMSQQVRHLVSEDPLIEFTLAEYDSEVQFLKDLIVQRISDMEEDLGVLGKVCADFSVPITSGALVINEFVASNAEPDGIPDPAGSFPDWIELYNNSDQAISMDNFYLSDDKDFLKRWSFPKDLVIEPFEYLIVWADRDLHEEGLHSNFKISKDGGALFLVYEDLTIIDSVSYEIQETNVAYARIPNGTGNFIYKTATWKENNEIDVSLNEDYSDLQINVFPNPASHEFILTYTPNPKIEQEEWLIYNSLGQVIKRIKYNNSESIVQVGNMSNGIYRIALSTDNLLLAQKNIVIAK